MNVSGLLGRLVLSAVLLVGLGGAAMACSSNDDANSTTSDGKAQSLSAAMAKLKAEAAKLGDPSSAGLDLLFGTTRINDTFTLVDAVAAEYGCTATLFVLKDGSFARVSTNVIKDGKRAVGTELDPNGPAIVQLRQGKSFAGVVDILGDLFDTIYEPIVDAKGAVVGAYYVGVKLPK